MIVRDFYDFFRRYVTPRRVSTSQETGPHDDVGTLRARSAELEGRLAESERLLRERTERLYDLQQQYASEHFSFQESARNLKIERMRNAGAFADREILLKRAHHLQRRVEDLKARLRRHEPVEDEQFDAPIVLDEP